MADAFYAQVPAKLSDQDKQLLYVKTNIGGFFFDAVLKTEHQSSVKITEHPVQTGANVSDHAYNEPDSLVMEIGMSDAMQGVVEGQYSDQLSRSKSAYETLRSLKESRLPLQVFTRLKTYNNMLIQNISAPDDVKTAYGLRATVTLREIFVVQVSKTTVSSRPQTTGSTNRGTVNPQPVEDPGSVLYQLEKTWGR